MTARASFHYILLSHCLIHSNRVKWCGFAHRMPSLHAENTLDSTHRECSLLNQAKKKIECVSVDLWREGERARDGVDSSHPAPPEVTSTSQKRIDLFDDLPYSLNYCYALLLNYHLNRYYQPISKYPLRTVKFAYHIINKYEERRSFLCCCDRFDQHNICFIHLCADQIFIPLEFRLILQKMYTIKMTETMWIAWIFCSISVVFGFIFPAIYANLHRMIWNR